MAGKSKPKPLNVYLYIPNIIGYLRILMNCVAFAVCFVDKKLFSLLYFVSFVCDALDGWFARKFNQEFDRYGMSLILQMGPKLIIHKSKALASCEVWLLYASFARHTAMGTITGHQLVECCGMTEFDGICNPIGRKHRGGTVGKPFPAVQANIFLNNESGSNKTGVRELCIKGPSSFRNIGSYLSQLGNHLPMIASTFGAVLDMVTDRVSTACLLVILSQVYRPGLVFLSLLALDISSHWLQMYSTFLVGKTSHKDVKDSSSWLFRLYYGNRMFMGYCCVSCEVTISINSGKLRNSSCIHNCYLILVLIYQVLYITLFLLTRKETDSLIDVLVNTATASWIYLVLLALLLFGWAIKQFVNVIQMKTAADACVLYDMNKKQ
ncbi:hypothetical protein MTR67_033773 [Solanum verrucosum]|uniref:CDP-diacylglycerol--inositol 3-phosphatidyltransferase n=1 Tax=Solanum verrucosum TaxID=315347 RepID=A0AAF0U6N5_SOLVR|nr:hypothetical protein MTR67_033773 [Solanum verrucosum]